MGIWYELKQPTLSTAKFRTNVQYLALLGFTFKSWLAMSLTSVEGYAMFMRIMNRLKKDDYSDDDLVKIKYGLAYINSAKHRYLLHTSR